MVMVLLNVAYLFLFLWLAIHSLTGGIFPIEEAFPSVII
jgi:hypothetical protein